MALAAGPGPLLCSPRPTRLGGTTRELESNPDLGPRRVADRRPGLVLGRGQPEPGVQRQRPCVRVRADDRPVDRRFPPIHLRPSFAPVEAVRPAAPVETPRWGPMPARGWAEEEPGSERRPAPVG